MTAVWIRDHAELLETHEVRALMAGNLCRCTGYDGIIDSVHSMIETFAESNPPGATVAESDSVGGD